MSTKIEWCLRPGTTGETWNPVVGCSKVSTGCKHCYAKTVHDKRHKAYLSGKLQSIPQYAHPFEKVQLMKDRLTLPLKWKKPRTVFVNSVSDLFHQAVPFHFIDQVFAVMALTPQHTYQVLTKRPERMAEYFSTRDVFVAEPPEEIPPWGSEHPAIGVDKRTYHQHPLPNVWLGTSVENQATAKERIPHLLKCPAAIRFLSCEPLLGPVEIAEYMRNGFGDCGCSNCEEGFFCKKGMPFHGIDWVIAGGESGKHARPMHSAWACSLRDQCADAGIPFFFKQWGEYAPHPNVLGGVIQSVGCMDLVMHAAYRIGRKAAGHLLDGKEYHEWPQPHEHLPQ